MTLARAAILCLAVLVATAVPRARAEGGPAATSPASRPASAAVRPGIADPDLRRRLEEIDARGGRIADLTAHFEQARHTPLLKKPLVSSGRVLVKGSRVRWTVEKPQPSVMVSSAKEIRIYYPQQKTVEVYDLDQRLGELAASPLPRLALLVKHFAIEALAPGAPGAPGTLGAAEEGEPPARPGLVRLRLLPADAGLRSHVAEVDVDLDPDLALAVGVTMIDPDGDRTIMRFSDIQLNRGLPDSALELEVPQGTTVVRPLEKMR